MTPASRRHIHYFLPPRALAALVDHGVEAPVGMRRVPSSEAPSQIFQQGLDGFAADAARAGRHYPGGQPLADIRDLVRVGIDLATAHGTRAVGRHDDTVVDLDGNDDYHGSCLSEAAWYKVRVPHGLCRVTARQTNGTAM